MNHYVPILFVAVGTYLMRFLPLKWSGNLEKAVHLNEFLDYSVSALLAALLVTSLVEFPLRSLELAIRALALLPALFA
ncbi:MAG: AzlD domain-containing protein, partial [Candidatus Caldatribacteriaceae bacterium]